MLCKNDDSRDNVFALNSSSLLMIWIWICVCCVAVFACTTNERDKAELFPRAFYDTVEMVRQKKGIVTANTYVDSAYAKVSYISTADQYNYYYFKACACDHLFNSKEDAEKCKLYYADSMISLIESKDQEKLLSYQYANGFKFKGDIFLDHHEYPTAYSYYSKARMISLRNGDTCAAVLMWSVIGNVMYKQRNYKEAVENYKLAVQYSSLCKDKELNFYHKFTSLSNLALSYTRYGLLDSAIKYYKTGIAYIQANRMESNMPSSFMDISLGIFYGNMAQTYAKKGFIQEASYWYVKSIAINDKEGYNQKDAAVTKLHFASLKMDLKQWDTVAVLLDEVERVLPENDASTRLRWRELKWQQSLGTRRVDTLAYQLGYYIFKDSVEAAEKAQSNTNLLASLVEEEKRQEVTALRKKNRFQYLLFIFASIIGVLLIGLAVLLGRNIKKNKRTMKKTEELNKELFDKKEQLTQLLEEIEERKEQQRRSELLQQEMNLNTQHRNEMLEQRKKISEDMHNDFTSSLAALGFYIDDIRKRPDTIAIRELLNDVKNEITTVYREARKYAHNLIEENRPVKHDLKNLLSELGKKFTEKTSLKVSLDVDYLKLDNLPVRQNETLYHFLKEGVSNIIKHADATVANIIIRFDDTKCCFSIEDNGRGFIKDQQTKGIGLKSLQNMIEKLNGNITIERTNNYTKIEGVFPIIRK